MSCIESLVCHQKSIFSMGTVFQHSGKSWYFSTICDMAVFSNNLDGEERAGCFDWFVLLVSSDCCVILPGGPWVCRQFVIVVFPDHTHYFYCLGSVPKVYIRLIHVHCRLLN